MWPAAQGQGRGSRHPVGHKEMGAMLQAGPHKAEQKGTVPSLSLLPPLGEAMLHACLGFFCFTVQLAGAQK